MVSLFSDFYNYYLFIFFQIINVPFPEEAKDKEEDRELPNSRMVVEIGLDEIPSTLGFDFQMF
jgi:hypothetical protein